MSDLEFMAHREEIERLTRERDEWRDRFDEAAAILRLPSSDNDGGPGDLREGIEAYMHNATVHINDLTRELTEARAWFQQAAMQRDAAEAERDRLKALLLKIGARLADIQDEILTVLKEQP